MDLQLRCSFRQPRQPAAQIPCNLNLFLMFQPAMEAFLWPGRLCVRVCVFVCVYVYL